MISQVSQTLDAHSKQAHPFDTVLEQLAQQAQHERQQQLQHTQKRQKWYWGGSVAIAASVRLLVSTPSLYQAQPPVVADTVAVASIEPQLLEDMDMLVVLGDEQ